MRAAARIAAVVVSVLGVGATAGGALAQSPDPLLGQARLQGTFQLAGRLTVAAHVRGERAGQTVSRSWSFSSSCPLGPCQTVELSRQRAAGTDALTLQQRSPGYYVGSGSFYAPLLCAGTSYSAGARVPFTITVRVTSEFVQGDTVYAGGISAAYTNPYRLNLTPCVAVLGHDAAVYQGQLVGPARDRSVRRRR